MLRIADKRSDRRSRVRFRRPHQNKQLPPRPLPYPVSESDSQARCMSSGACPSALAASRPLLPRCLPAGHVASVTGSKPDCAVARADCRTRVDDSDGRRRFRHHTERLRADRIPLLDKGTTYERPQSVSETARGKPDTLRSASHCLRCDGGMKGPRGLVLDE